MIAKRLLSPKKSVRYTTLGWFWRCAPSCCAILAAAAAFSSFLLGVRGGSPKIGGGVGDCDGCVGESLEELHGEPAHAFSDTVGLGDALRGIRLYEQRRVDAIALRVTTFTQPRCMKKAECETLPATRMYLPAR
jgi:hypothetical protein